jgi:uncharacterized SAM-binding protein YcdF (DUF218 family)
MTRRIRLVAIIIVILIFLGALLLLIREPLLFATGNFLVIKDELIPADVIHVIAGPDYRTDFAVRLYQQGYAKEIFFTGAWCSKHMVNHSEHGKQLAIDEGVPGKAIATDGSEIDTTYAEAARLKDLISKSQVPIHSVIIVSDPYHMRRARWAYRKVLGDQIKLQMAPVPFEMLPYSPRWWTDPESRLMVRDEFIKTIFYYARYEFSWGPMREWLATFDKY